MYSLKFDLDWLSYFEKVPEEVKKRFLKRIGKYESFPTFSFRHSRHGLGYFVDEMGQYRVCFVSDENEETRTFYFIGDHKEYEKFIGTRK